MMRAIIENKYNTIKFQKKSYTVKQKGLGMTSERRQYLN